ncbi:MAG: hypothetical protein IT373_32550 [Polyangiaceae bacterium]|nr:hypothetical protein [Polyangiaceae bacterium]
MSQERAEQLLDEIRALPRAERLRLVERVVHELATTEEATLAGGVIGLFADEPELIDAVVEGAMQARERDGLRLGRG